MFKNRYGKTHKPAHDYYLAVCCYMDMDSGNIEYTIIGIDNARKFFKNNTFDDVAIYKAKPNVNGIIEKYGDPILSWSIWDED